MYVDVFVGDETIQSNLERKTKRRLEQIYNPFDDVMAKRSKLETKVKTNKDENVLDFLKSRPQIAALESSATKDRKTGKIRSSRTTNGEEAADLLHSDRFVSVLGSPPVTMEAMTDDMRLTRLVF